MTEIRITANKKWKQKEQKEYLTLNFHMFKNGELHITKEVKWTLRENIPREQVYEMLDRIRALIEG